MKIVEYNSCKDVVVEFQDKYKYHKNASYGNFKTGKISNPYYKTIFNRGYLGTDDVKYTDMSYIVWCSMFKRCYSNYNEISYNGCEVCEEWYNYVNFKRWFDKNYYEIPNENMHLDKDILIKDNKIYSPKTCIFVPQRINKLFTKRQNDRGLCPIGVTERKNNKYKKFESRCSIGNGKRISLGYFYTKEEAFKAYKEYKEKYIRQIADEYKSKYPNFPQKLYDAMYNYQVWEDD